MSLRKLQHKAPRSILVIVQRSNGDVFLSSPLIEGLHNAYGGAQIDLLVNDDTLAVARTLPHIRNIYQFSYKAEQGHTNELFRAIVWRYDLAIGLTASDRSVLFALAAGRRAISAVEADRKRSWWKRMLLSAWYAFDIGGHIIENNTAALGLLGIGSAHPSVAAYHSEVATDKVKSLLAERGIGEFIIFHPGAQYDYKIYPVELRNQLLTRLNSLGVPIVVTGSKSEVDLNIKRSLPSLSNVYDFIGLTSMDELIALSERSLAYIGADTLNMHIAAAQDRRVFAIFGPTFLSMWSPWSNALHRGTGKNSPVQTYGNITLFQADMECVACGKAGCDDHHGPSECLHRIDPDIIYKEVAEWLKTSR